MSALPPEAARFINALKIMANIDRDELTAAGLHVDDTHWPRFTNQPDIWFMKASDADAAKVWQLIEARQPKEPIRQHIPT